MTSWVWPVDSDSVAQIYMQPGWDLNNIQLNDLATTFSIWRRCQAVPRAVVTLADPLKQFRDDMAHKYSTTLEVDDAKRIQAFQDIKVVLTDARIQAAILNHGDLMQQIHDLEQGHLYALSDDTRRVLDDIENKHDDLKTKLQDFRREFLDKHEDVFEIRVYLRQLIAEFRTTRNALLVISVLVVLCAVVVGLYGNFSSTYSQRITHETPQGYLPNHEPEHGG